MPKISTRKKEEKIALSTAGVASVDKALTILGLFTTQSPELTLMQITDATGLYKSGVLRAIASLENALLVTKNSSGNYVLGPAIAALHAAYKTHDALEAFINPALAELTKLTNESAAFHVRQGDKRLCLFRVDSNQALRDHIRVGDLLPIKQGAGGKVIQAFEGASGKKFQKIRSEMVLAIAGDRTKEISGISSPVFNADGLIGVITLTMPTYRFDPNKAEVVKNSAKKLTKLLGGQFTFPQMA